jgi:hypothetical protein
VVGGGDARRPFIGSEGERGGRASEGNGRRRWGTIMVVEATISRGDRPGWWGGDEGGGCSSCYESGWGAERRQAHAREMAVVAAAVGLGRKTTARGPHVGERGRLARPAGRLRPSGRVGKTCRERVLPRGRGGEGRAG